MVKRILEVGNCAADHAAMTELIDRHFKAEIAQAHTFDEALTALRNERYDLVLINRQLDRDNSDGVELIRKIKGDRDLAQVPVVLLSNYAEYQQRAMEAGAAPGFGKAELTSPETQQKLKDLLG